MIFLIALLFSFFETAASTSNKEESGNWTTAIFALPLRKTKDANARDCYHFSERFCYLGRFIARGAASEAATMRVKRTDDYYQFRDLIKLVYKTINWYSFEKVEWGGCCMKQLGVYKEWGQEHGISPQEYYEEVINFTSDNRKVNLISAQYSRSLCVNIVTSIGFGTGPIAAHENHQATYILSPNTGGMIHFFPYDKIRDQLTWDWFKLNILCEEQAWICVKYPPNAIASGS
ncbi:uncharacterized protein LOC134854973 [Symsagittifera roscoffensis]|uniref:uncharacterized protein LOC134854973 n=1 Tax=Symsagittifera roscoffensis TaxID=84072 RepID=UPI00307C4BB7